MDNVASLIAWAMCLIVGAPMVLIGSFHLLLPEAAWSLYRGWGRLWGADPMEIAPNYKYGTAMRAVGFVLGLGGIMICFMPNVMGH